LAGSQGPEDIPYHEQQERRTKNDNAMSDTSSGMVGPLVFADATSPRPGRGGAEEVQFFSSYNFDSKFFGYTAWFVLLL